MDNYAHSNLPYLHVIIPLIQDGATPQFIASQLGHSDVVNILIRNGADINLACNVWRYYMYRIHSHCKTVEGSATRLTGDLMYMFAVLVSYGYCRVFIHCHTLGNNVMVQQMCASCQYFRAALSLSI